MRCVAALHCLYRHRNSIFSGSPSVSRSPVYFSLWVSSLRAPVRDGRPSFLGGADEGAGADTRADGGEKAEGAGVWWRAYWARVRYTGSGRTELSIVSGQS